MLLVESLSFQVTIQLMRSIVCNAEMVQFNSVNIANSVPKNCKRYEVVSRKMQTWGVNIANNMMCFHQAPPIKHAQRRKWVLGQLRARFRARRQHDAGILGSMSDGSNVCCFQKDV